MKSLRYEHDYSERNFDRHRRDALAAERLTRSQYITDIYSYCANSGLFEFASEGSLTDAFDRHYAATVASGKKDGGNIEDDSLRNGLLDSSTKLKSARDLALALADLHEADAVLDSNGGILSSAVVHADISSDQVSQLINFHGHLKVSTATAVSQDRRHLEAKRLQPLQVHETVSKRR